jgi:DNA repair exonuclease SbcCD nuclease subunit
MKLVHIADTHLGLAQFQKVDPDTGMNLREKLIYTNFLAAVDRIIKLRPDVVVHAGDLFDQVRPKTMAYTTALEALERFSGAGIPLVLISGNHSMPKTRYTPSPFRVLEFHPGTLHAAYSYRYERVEIGEAVFHLVPNMLRPEHYREAYDRITPDGNRYNILVTHGLASSLKEKRLNTVAEHEIDATMISGGGMFGYIALGHYHGQIPVGEQAWYSGSIEYLTYGEIGDIKGGLCVDPGRGTVEHVPLPHTPITDLGTIDAREVPPREVPGLIRQRLEENRVTPLSMASVTLCFSDREHQRQLAEKEIAGIRRDLLDLKIRVRIPGEYRRGVESRDIRSIDYIAEYAKFVSGKNLPPGDRDFVSEYGSRAISLALEEERPGAG